jgi:hypothetical protein
MRKVAPIVDRQRRLEFANRLGVGRGPTGEDGDLLVSITTYPPRFGSCHVAIESILQGSLLPAHVIVWVAESDVPPEGLPASMMRLARRGVTIRFVSEDFGPANKLVHALRDSPERVIVTADDDVVYPRHWLADLRRAARDSPNEVIAHRAHHLTIEGGPGVGQRVQLRPYEQTALDEDAGGASPMYSLLPLGVSGVLYPPGSVHAMVHDRKMFEELARRNDDIWFKAMTLRTGTRARRVGTRNSPVLRTVRGSQHVQLAARHVDGGDNDAALPAVLEHFDLLALLRLEQQTTG